MGINRRGLAAYVKLRSAPLWLRDEFSPFAWDDPARGCLYHAGAISGALLGIRVEGSGGLNAPGVVKVFAVGAASVSTVMCVAAPQFGAVYADCRAYPLTPKRPLWIRSNDGLIIKAKIRQTDGTIFFRQVDKIGAISYGHHKPTPYRLPDFEDTDFGE